MMTELNRELLEENLEEKYGIFLYYKLENLKEINLDGYGSKNKIKKFDCITFKGLDKLEVLYLGWNEITEIDGNLFSDLSNLKRLYIHSNKLKRIDSITFKGLSKLEILWLNHNELTEIDENLFSDLSNLKVLFLNHNKLARIDSISFKGLKNLKKLWLSDNEITEIGGNAFSNLSNLIELRLFNNKLKNIDSITFKELIHLDALLENHKPFFIFDKKHGLLNHELIEIIAKLESLSINFNDINYINVTEINLNFFENLKP